MELAHKGKHRGNVDGWAIDRGKDRARLAAGKRRYGKHGIGHEGLTETQAESRITAAYRYITNKPKNGKHGVSEDHPIGQRIKAIFDIRMAQKYGHLEMEV